MGISFENGIPLNVSIVFLKAIVCRTSALCEILSGFVVSKGIVINILKPIESTNLILLGSAKMIPLTFSGYRN
jgi:hypothetical protein